jgi:hypothetical protein
LHGRFAHRHGGFVTISPSHPACVYFGGSGRRPSLMDGVRSSWKRARRAERPLRCSGRDLTVRSTERPREAYLRTIEKSKGALRGPTREPANRATRWKRPATARRHVGRCSRAEAVLFPISSYTETSKSEEHAKGQECSIGSPPRKGTPKTRRPVATSTLGDFLGTPPLRSLLAGAFSPSWRAPPGSGAHKKRPSGVPAPRGTDQGGKP